LQNLRLNFKKGVFLGDFLQKGDFENPCIYWLVPCKMHLDFAFFEMDLAKCSLTMLFLKWTLQKTIWTLLVEKWTM